MKNKGCIIDGCENTHHIRGLCRNHYQQQSDKRAYNNECVRASVKRRREQDEAHRKKYSGVLREKFLNYE